MQLPFLLLPLIQQKQKDTMKTETFKNGQKVQTMEQGNGKVVGYVGYAGKMLVRVEFTSGKVIDFHPSKLQQANLI